MAGLLAVAFAGHLAVQVHVITHYIEPPSRGFEKQILASAAVLRKAGITGDCLLVGATGNSAPLAYRLGCGNWVPNHDALYRDIHRGVHVAWIRNSPPSHLWGIHWDTMSLPWLTPTQVYISTTRLLKPAR